MHSLIAAGRLVNIRGVYYAKPFHTEDPGPATFLRKNEETFCRPTLHVHQPARWVEDRGSSPTRLGQQAA